MKIRYFGTEYEVLPYIQATVRARRDIPDEPIIEQLCVAIARKMLADGIIETITEPDETDYDKKYVSARAKCLKRINHEETDERAGD